MSRWYWSLLEKLNSLWLRASVYAIVAVITALSSIYARRFIPEDISQNIGADAVDSILHILASSMLAVTIFSVSTMVSAYGAATTNVTPRATRLLIEDKLSHNALSTFLGSFIFSIVGIIALSAGVYGAAGRLILYLVTIVLIVFIIATLIRWIEYLSRLGRVSETILKVEEATAKSLEDRLRAPFLGATPLHSEKRIPDNGFAVPADDIGYIQHIDMSALSSIAAKRGIEVYLLALPGQLVDPSVSLATTDGALDLEGLKQVQGTFVIGKERSFQQDPRYGLAVLSEIATRALSPAVNDAGTAIQVLSVGLRVLSRCAAQQKPAADAREIKFPRLHAPALAVDDLFEDFFSPIGEAGAGTLSVALRLQRVLLSLHRTGDSDLKRASLHHSSIARQRSALSLTLPGDRARVEEVAAQLLP